MSNETTRERVRRMIEQGHRPRDIALVLGISTQAVYQHRNALGLTPKAKRLAEEQAS